jgi:peptidoglycan/xylan/chitin deacetylase (PgdA/CDA1 family)
MRNGSDGAVVRRSAFRTPRSPVPVLCYHRVGGPLELGVTRVGRRTFIRQMRALANAGWRTVTLAEYYQAVCGGSAFRLPRSALLLSFDDGYAELAEHAYPVLADLGFTATTFLITDYVGRENTWDVRYTWRRLRHLDWAAIDEWKARGFEFGAHGATHRRLTWLPDDAVRDDLGRARDVLVARLGPESGQALAYPFGASDARIARIAAETGFRVAFNGVRGDGTNLLDVPRVPVYAWDRFAVPLGLQEGIFGRVGRFAAHVANRCSVGTSLMLRVVGRGDRGRGKGEGEGSSGGASRPFAG